MITLRLLIEQIGMGVAGIDPEKPLPHIVQTERCVNVARFNLQPDTGAGNEVAINTVPGRLELRTISAKPLVIPKMDACLVLDVDIDAQIMKEMFS